MFMSSWMKALCAVALLAAPFSARALTIDERATQITNAFSDDEIIGQMTQLNIDAILTPQGTLDENKARAFARLKVGSYLNTPFAGGVKNNKVGWTATEWRDFIARVQTIHMEETGGHPMIFGLDSVHGANYVEGATIFGQQINAGASYNPKLVFQMGQITGRDTIAAGVPWIFGPILEISQNPLWSRTYETFGEDPHLVSVMGAQLIQGIQNNTNVAACMKHFIGYSKTPTGHDRDPVTLSDFDLLNYFAPPFLAAIKAGVLTAMENYVSINGVPTIKSGKLLKDLLRDDMGFEGFIVTDWAEINNLNWYHRVAKSVQDAVRMTLTRTTLDMSMVPDDTQFIDQAKQVLAQYPAIRERLRASARRIVKVKLKLGLYENPVPGKEHVAKVGQAADKKVAVQLARESVVLLQNKDKVLPLPEAASVFLTGHSAHNIGNLCGGWTLHWQGVTGNDQYKTGTTIKQGMEAIGGGAVSFMNGLNVDGSYSEADLNAAKQMARSATYTVVAIGENPYTEKPGDISELALPWGQLEYVRQLASTGTKVIVVFVGGRPRLLGDLPDKVHAVINAMLPGQFGGEAIAEIIYGRVSPSGRMPVTYHKSSGNVVLPYNRVVTTTCATCQTQWDFGWGMSYAEFAYSAVTLSKSTVNGGSDTITASVTVTNTGPFQGKAKETVMLFLTQPFREIAVPEVKMLKKFQKIELKNGESKTVTFTIDSSDWSVFDPQIGNGFLRVAESGDFIVAIKPETDCKVYEGNGLASPLCAKFTLTASSTFEVAADSSTASVPESVEGAGRVVAFNG